MKVIYSILFLLIPFYGIGQTGINYQGAATDSQGSKLENQSISLRTSILQGGIEGITSYSETHNTTTDQFGLFNVVIGLGNVLTGSFDSIQWGVDAHFLKVELDATGGTNYNLVSTTQMMSVPYAKYAENAGLDSIKISEIINNSYSEIFLEYVEMGISPTCSGLGLDINDISQLQNEDYSYNISHQITPDNGLFFSYPHWIKFKINGLKLNSNDKLKFKTKYYNGYLSSYDYSYLSDFIDPQFDDDGNVYFYIYVGSPSYTTSNCIQNYINYTSIGNSGFQVYKNYTGGSGNDYHNDIEILYTKNNTLKNSGIFLKLNHN